MLKNKKNKQSKQTHHHNPHQQNKCPQYTIAIKYKVSLCVIDGWGWMSSRGTGMTVYVLEDYHNLQF